MPCEPSASKKASCGLIPTTTGAAALMRPRQKRPAAAAAPSTPTASPWSSTGSRSMTGSRPRTSWLRLRSTESARRSAKCAVAVPTCVISPKLTRPHHARSRGGVRNTSGRSGALLEIFEAEDFELWWRPPEELPDEQDVVGVLRREGRLGASCLREARRQLDSPTRPGADGANRRDVPFREEVGPSVCQLRCRDEQAEPGAPQAVEPCELGRERFDGHDSIPQARRVLEPQRLDEAREPAPQARQRSGRPVEFRRLEHAGRELRAPPAPHRPVLRGLRRHDDAIVPRVEVDVAIRSRRARVRGRSQLTQQPELLERRLQLRPELAPFDSLCRKQRRLNRRALLLRAEVRAEPRPEVTRPADVEDAVMRVAEQVDARRRGSAVR